jgi:hypothetical protein
MVKPRGTYDRSQAFTQDGPLWYFPIATGAHRFPVLTKIS